MKHTSNTPLVTVLMTAYNAQRFIGQAIQSIRNQTYNNFELIVVDDNSKDQTFAIAKQHQALDKRIKVLRMTKHRGPSTASNVGLRKARGTLIARMDADDIAVANRIEKQVKFLHSHPKVVIVGGQCRLINEKGAFIGEKYFPTEHKAIYSSLFRMNPIQHPACMFRRDCLPKSFMYHNHSLLAHDLELVFEISQYGKLANLPDILLLYRQHEGSLSLRNPKATFDATVRVRIEAIKKYHYIPSITGVLAHIAQVILIGILPQRSIYPLFLFVRTKRQFSLREVVTLFSTTFPRSFRVR